MSLKLETVYGKYILFVDNIDFPLFESALAITEGNSYFLGKNPLALLAKEVNVLVVL